MSRSRSPDELREALSRSRAECADLRATLAAYRAERERIRRLFYSMFLAHLWPKGAKTK